MHASRSSRPRTCVRPCASVLMSLPRTTARSTDVTDGRRRASGQTSDVDINRGQRYSILPALAVDGYIACRVVKGSVKGPEFFDFIVNDVVRSLDCGLHAHSLLQLPLMNPFPGDRSVLIMDNCSIHKSQVLREVVEAAGAQSCALLLPVLTHAVPQVFSWCLYRRTRPSLTLSRRASML